MRRHFPQLIPLVGLALATVVSPAGAQTCLLCEDQPAAVQRGTGADGGTATGRAAETIERRVPLRITIITNLEFARLTTRGGGGTVSVDPVTGAMRARGDVAPVGGLAFTGRAEVTGRPGREVRVMLPEQILMTSPSGGTIRVRNLTTNLPPAPQLGPDGRLEFSFGGDLTVEGDAAGEYRGQIELSVAYE